MKITAIIAEYNPFHNGHAYQIQKARELTQADAILVVMSGNFVQRGTPAVFDKYTRARMAIQCGADLVLELPCIFSTASAEYFALGAVSLLDSLSCIDSLVFGAESDQLKTLLALAGYLLHPDKDFLNTLSKLQKEGLSYPVARTMALKSSICSQPDFPCEHPDELEAILQLPNNILGLEYCKALLTIRSNISPVLLQRTSANYHASSLSGEFCSATAIRSLLFDSGQDVTAKLAQLKSVVPPATLGLYETMLQSNCCLSEQTLSLPLHLKLLSEQDRGFSTYLDVTDKFSSKIQKELANYTDFTSFAERLKSKDITYTRICRNLLHIFLDIQKDSIPSLDSIREFYTVKYDSKGSSHNPLAFYARPLAMSQTGRKLLSVIGQNATIPLLSKISDWDKTLLEYPFTEASQKENAHTLFALDLAAAHTYEAMKTNLAGLPFQHEYQRRLLFCE